MLKATYHIMFIFMRFSCFRSAQPIYKHTVFWVACVCRCLSVPYKPKPQPLTCGAASLKLVQLYQSDRCSCMPNAYFFGSSIPAFIKLNFPFPPSSRFWLSLPSPVHCCSSFACGLIFTQAVLKYPPAFSLV